MANREFSTQVYGYLRKGGLTNKADPLRGIVAKLLAAPKKKAGGEALHIKDFRDKMKAAIEQLTKAKGVNKASATVTLHKIMRRVLPKGDYRVGVLKGKSVAPTRRKVVESAVRGTTAQAAIPPGAAMAGAAKAGAAKAGAAKSGKAAAVAGKLGGVAKIKQAFSKGGKFAGGLTGLFTVLAVNELLNVVLADKRANRQLDVQEGAVSPESEYYRQMQPLLQQDYAASQAQMLQAFGGGAGGGLSSVTGETVIGGGR